MVLASSMISLIASPILITNLFLVRTFYFSICKLLPTTYLQLGFMNHSWSLEALEPGMIKKAYISSNRHLNCKEI